MARMSAEQRRERLLEAAVAVMTRDGVAAGTTRAIVAEAGMAVSVFHYCFRSREELVREVILRLQSGERTQVLAAVAPGADVRATLANAADGFMDYLVKEPGDQLVLFELNHYALRTPSLSDLAVEQYAGYYATARAVLEAVAEIHGVTWSLDLDVLARMVVTLIDGVTTTWLADRDTLHTRLVLDHLLDHVATLAVPA